MSEAFSKKRADLGTTTKVRMTSAGTLEVDRASFYKSRPYLDQIEALRLIVKRQKERNAGSVSAPQTKKST
jgi:hypothetical protein